MLIALTNSVTSLKCSKKLVPSLHTMAILSNLTLLFRPHSRMIFEPLEDVPASHLDWHPDSNEMVLHLVHPSLFSVVYGQTRILSNTIVGLDDCVRRCGEGETLPVLPLEKAQKPWLLDVVPMHNPYSRKFQWLPCEVAFDGDKAKYVTSIFLLTSVVFN